MPVNDSLASEMWTRFRYCLERGHYDFLQKANKCDNYFVGEQWAQSDLFALQLARRPALTINKIISTMSTIMGEQIYNRNEITYRPAGEGATSTTADALCKVWQQIAHNNQLSWLRSDVFASGIIRSRGFYDVRMDFGENLRGNISIKLLNSKNVVIDPDAEEYDPDSWNDMFTTKWLTYQDIATLYKQADAEYLKDREESLFPYAYDSIERLRDRYAGPSLTGSYYGLQDKSHVRRNIRVLERQYRVLSSQDHFVDIETGDTRPVPIAWDRNRIAAVMAHAPGQLAVIKKKVKRVRWTVTADNVVLHDDWSPYKRFTAVPFFPHFHYGRAVGLVENLISPQELLNKVSSQELHVVNTSANSGWKVESNNLVNMSIEELEQGGAQSGLVVEVKKIDGLEKITPNAVPQGMDRISYKSEEHMKTISGVSDSMQGFDREDVAAKAIAAKRQTGKTNLVKVMDNLERSDYFLARAVLDLVQEFYTEERVIRVVHSDLDNESEEIVVNQHNEETGEILNDLTLGEYSIVVASAPDRDTLEDSQFAQAKELREMGVALPDDVLIENSRLQRRSDIAKQIKASKETPEAKQQQALQLRAQEASVKKLEGEAIEKHTKAALDSSRAAKENAETQQMEGGGPSPEERKLEAQLQADRERLDMERQAHDAKLQQEREMHEQKLEFMREEQALKMQAQREQADEKKRLMEEQHYAQRAQAAAAKPAAEAT